MVDGDFLSMTLLNFGFVSVSRVGVLYGNDSLKKLDMTRKIVIVVDPKRKCFVATLFNLVV